MNKNEILYDLYSMIDDFQFQANKEKHFGDCTNEPNTCLKCLNLNYVTTLKETIKYLKVK